VSLEVAAPFAIFARPDTGSAPVSYPVPTYSAAKGMFEAVARLARGRAIMAEIIPTHVEICSDIRYERYITNYGGPLRKSDQIRHRTNYQLIATILVDVSFRLYAEVEAAPTSRQAARDCHQLQDMFERRLRNGQSFYTPCLGWKEFVPSYFGPLRGETTVNREINLHIPSLLHSVFDRAGRVSPVFHQDSEIRDGLLSYTRRPEIAE